MSPWGARHVWRPFARFCHFELMVLVGVLGHRWIEAKVEVCLLLISVRCSAWYLLARQELLTQVHFPDGQLHEAPQEQVHPGAGTSVSEGLSGSPQLTYPWLWL
jgi:hypothetical protein